MKRPCSLRSQSRLYIRALESISLSLPKFSEGCHRISVIPSYLSSGRVFSRTQPEYVMGSLFSCYWGSSVEITCNSGTLISKKWHEFCPTSLVWQSQLPALLTVHFSGRDYVPRSGGGWHACLFICCIFKLKHVFWMLPVTLHCWEDPSAFHSLRFLGPWSLCCSLESIYSVCLWPGSHSCYYKHIAD